MTRSATPSWRSKYFDYLAQFSVPLLELLAGQPPCVIDCGGTDWCGLGDGEAEALKVAFGRLGIDKVAALLAFETDEANERYFARDGGTDAVTGYVLRNARYKEIACRTFYTHGGDLRAVATELVAWARDEQPAQNER